MFRNKGQLEEIGKPSDLVEEYSFQVKKIELVLIVSGLGDVRLILLKLFSPCPGTLILSPG